MDYNQNNNQQGYQSQDVDKVPQGNYYDNSKYEPNQYTAPQYNQPPYNQPQYNQPPFGQPPYNQPPMYPMPVKKEGKGMAIASLVSGILSVTCCCGSIIPSILAIVFGIISKQQKESGNGMAVAGIILGAISILLSVAYILFFVTTGELQATINDIHSYYQF